jgi:hypothetical protein
MVSVLLLLLVGVVAPSPLVCVLRLFKRTVFGLRFLKERLFCCLRYVFISVWCMLF